MGKVELVGQVPEPLGHTSKPIGRETYIRAKVKYARFTK